MEARTHAAGRGTLLTLRTAGRALGLLADAGIRAVAFKGSAVAEWLYDDVAERALGDADLFVVDSFLGAARVLEVEGYSVADRSDHAWAFRDPQTQLLVELHCEATSAGLFDIDREALFARSVSRPGIVSRIPSAEDLLLLACLHASYQHGLVLRRDQWEDFSRLARTSLDTAVLSSVVRPLRAEAAVISAVLAAQAVCGVDLPAAWRLGATLPAGLAAWLEPRLASAQSFLPPSRPELARVRWLLLAGRRVELIRRTLWPSSEAMGSGNWRLALRRGWRLGRGLFGS